MLPSYMHRLRDLEDENSRLKRIVADLALDREMLQDIINRNTFVNQGPHVSARCAEVQISYLGNQAAVQFLGKRAALVPGA